MKTLNLDIELLCSHQAQKEISINEAFIKIDSLLNSGAISITMNTPPDSPTNGDTYIIGPQQLWSGYPYYITYYYYNQWYFLKPKTGSLMWVNNQKDIFYYSDEKWNPYKMMLNNHCN